MRENMSLDQFNKIEIYEGQKTEVKNFQEDQKYSEHK